MDLDEEKLLKIQQFQEITAVEDFEMAQCTLASLDWNLERAIEAQLSDSMPGAPAALADDIHILDEVADIPESARRPPNPERAARPRVPLLETDPFLLADDGIRVRRTNESPPRTRPGKPTRNGNSNGNAASSSSRAMDIVDSDEEMHDDEMDFVHGHESNHKGNSQIPLVPVDVDCVTDALHNFVSVFEARYAQNKGYAMPHFFTDSLDKAIKEAFDAPGRGIENRRPLAIYIHSDTSIAANIFAANVLCKDSISSLLRGQFVLWPWDITHKENKVKLIEWIYALGMTQVREAIDSFALIPSERLPLLMVVIKEKGVYRISQVCFGMDSPEMVMDKLMMGLDEYASVRVSEASDARDRAERERIRQEQAFEYEAALAADKARIEAKELEEQRQREEEERARREQEEEEFMRAKLASELPDEPAEGSPGCLVVRFRLPEGEQCVRRFRTTENLDILLKYLSAKGYSTDKYRYFNSDFPKKDISKWDASSTFSALKWPLREQVFVEEQ